MMIGFNIAWREEESNRFCFDRMGNSFQYTESSKSSVVIVILDVGVQKLSHRIRMNQLIIKNLRNIKVPVDIALAKRHF